MAFLIMRIEVTFLHDSDWKFQMDNELPITEITVLIRGI